MRRILFVDDDPNVLSGLRRMLRSQRHEWDMTFAGGGEAALEQLASGSFDVVVTDMRMPGIDGAALLAEMRQRHPGVVRIILSGHTEMSAALRSVPVAHQFLSKPCDPEALMAAVRRACALEERLQDPKLRRLVGEVTVLPSPPSVLVALNELLMGPDTSVDAVADVVGQDPAMSAKLLQLVNSAFFGLAQPLTVVREAVAYLGINLVRSLAVAAQAFQSFEAELPEQVFSVDALHRHSLAVAHLTQDLVAPAHRNDAFAAGLLHDVGLLVLASAMPDRFTEVCARVEATGQPMAEVEAGLIGATHADIGAYLLSLWGLPYPIVEAVAYHHSAPDQPHPELDSLHATYVAEAILEQRGDASHSWERSRSVLTPHYVEALGLSDKLQSLGVALTPSDGSEPL